MSGKSISGFGHYSNRLAHQCDDVSATIPTAELQERLLQLLYNSATIENDDDICGAAENYLEAFVDIESLVLDNSFTETDDLMAFTDRAKLEQTEFDILCKEDDGRISLAYERLPGIPKKVADQFASKTHTLDLSYNDIKDLTFLCNFKILHTLILDHNTSLNEKTMPFMPNLQILWLNKCAITNLPRWIQRLKVCTPNLRQLSFMGNPGSLSLINGSSVLEYNDYLMYIIGNFNKLDHLDDIKITEAQRNSARTYMEVYTMKRRQCDSQITFMDRFTNSNIMTFFKYDPKRHRPQMTATLIPPRSSLHTKPSTSTGRQ